jgi:hypothetical protein
VTGIIRRSCLCHLQQLYACIFLTRACHLHLQLIGAELPDLDTFLEDHGLDQNDGMLNWADFHALMAVEGDEDDLPVNP